MTLSLAWIRKNKDTEELVLASDSRLRFGKAWDGCSKVFPLLRGDCALAFAGDTEYAYPLIHQVMTAVNAHPKAAERAMDISSLRGYLLRIFNDMEQWIHDFPVGNYENEPPDIRFIFAGFSWQKSEFKIWIINYKRSERRFVYHTPRTFHGNRLGAIGDSVPEFKARLIDLMDSKKKRNGMGFDYEPFEILRDIIRDETDPAIGGAPVLLKVYKHMNSMPYSVYWPKRKNGKPTLLGRPLMAFEKTLYLHFDPDMLKTFA